jgi:hypothetical protein
MDARRLSAAFQLRENVPTCSAGVSGSLRRGAKARIGRGGFASPPVGAAGSIRATPHWRSLTRLHPRLAADIHPELNGQLDPASSQRVRGARFGGLAAAAATRGRRRSITEQLGVSEPYMRVRAGIRHRS